MFSPINASTKARELLPVLVVDDDADDCMLMRKAFERNDYPNPLTFLSNGEELLHFLDAQERKPRGYAPALIILDLNMPVMDGRETLQELKADERFRRIPVIVLSSSNAPEDVIRMYDLGVNAYMTKPVTFEALVHTVRCLGEYWLKLALVPLS